MADRKVDRQAWAAEIARLVQEEADGNKSAFARMVGLKSVKTIDRWLAGSVEVSQANILLVCRALQLEPLPMLEKMGLIDPAEFHRYDRFAAPQADQRALDVITTADIPPRLKRQLLDHLEAQRAEHERQRLAEVERMIDLIQRNEPRAG